MKDVLTLLWSHRTKLLGYAQVILGSLAVADAELINGVLGPDGSRWIVLVSGVLTAIVGHWNSTRRANAHHPGSAVFHRELSRDDTE